MVTEYLTLQCHRTTAHLVSVPVCVSICSSSLWGEAAVAYLRDTSLHASSGGGALKSLWNDGCLDRVLQQLDRSMLLATAVNIPLEMKLIVSFLFCSCVSAVTCGVQYTRPMMG